MCRTSGKLVVRNISANTINKCVRDCFPARPTNLSFVKQNTNGACSIKTNAFHTLPSVPRRGPNMPVVPSHSHRRQYDDRTYRVHANAGHQKLRSPLTRGDRAQSGVLGYAAERCRPPHRFTLHAWYLLHNGSYGVVASGGVDKRPSGLARRHTLTRDEAPCSRFSAPCIERMCFAGEALGGRRKASSNWGPVGDDQSRQSTARPGPTQPGRGRLRRGPDRRYPIRPGPARLGPARPGADRHKPGSA